MNALKLFALNESKSFGLKVSEHLGIPLSQHEERGFEDGEHKVRPLETVRNIEVFVVQSLYQDESYSVNDKLCRLLFFLGALKDAGAAKVNVVTPYLCYMRKDRKTKAGDPVTTRYLAALFEAVKTDCLITMDVHNLQAFQNAFRINTENLEAQDTFAQHFSENHASENFVVLSPDSGGVKRSQSFRNLLQEYLGNRIPFSFLEKERSEGVVSGETIVGNMENKSVIILDDLISSGTTMVRAAKACKEKSASKVYAVATHGAFIGNSENILNAGALDQVIITNTINTETVNHPKIKVLDVAPLFAEICHDIHRGSVTDELQEL